MNRKAKNNDHEIINKWTNSKKFAEFKMSIENKRKNLQSLKLKLAKGNVHSKQEVKVIISLMKDLQSSKEQDEFDMDYFAIIGNEDTIYSEYLSRIYNWFNFLLEYIEDEEYELAAEIRDVVLIEELNFVNMIYAYRQDLIDEDSLFIKKIKLVKEVLYNLLNETSDKRSDN